MAELKAQKGSFGSVEGESYNLAPEDEKKDKKVIINIAEESGEGILLPGKEEEKSGNVLRDYYGKVNRYFISRSSVATDAKANFFHLLGVMINSGVPMVQSLESLVKQSEKSPKLQLVLEEMKSAVEGGASLSEAMSNYPDVFSEKDIGMIESGELSGKLTGVLEDLAHDTMKAHEVKSKVKSAMIYPVVVFLLLIAVVVAMLVFVIPKLSELFASSGEQLPLITRIVVGMSDFLIEKKLTLLLIVGGIVLVFMIMKRTNWGKYALDKFKISVPVFGKLFTMAYLSRFARSLSNRLGSGLSIVRTIEITAVSIGNEVYKKKLMLAAEDVKQGIPLAESLTNDELFPPMLVNMVEVGEKTAQLSEITAKVADFYEKEVDTSVAGLSKVLEPIILIAIGLTVGAVVAAVMLPIMQLSDIAGTF